MREKRAGVDGQHGSIFLACAVGSERGAFFVLEAKYNLHAESISQSFGLGGNQHCTCLKTASTYNVLVKNKKIAHECVGWTYISSIFCWVLHQSIVSFECHMSEGFTLKIYQM